MVEHEQKEALHRVTGHIRKELTEPLIKRGLYDLGDFLSLHIDVDIKAAQCVVEQRQRQGRLN